MTARRLLVAFLLFALVTAQPLGLVHQAVHGHGQLEATANAAHTQTSAAGSLASLFAAHPDDAGCLLFDQLSHGDVATVAVMPAAQVASVFLLPLYGVHSLCN